MAKEIIQTSKKEIQQLLNSQTKAILNLVDKKMDEKIDKLALMIGEGFNGVDKKFETLTGEMNNNFKKVNQQINNINLNTVDVVRLEDFNKLEGRVIDVEEVLHLKVKNN